MFNRFFVASLAALFLSVLAIPDLVQAQGAGVSISPALIEETLDPGTFVEYEFEIRNLDGVQQTYYLFTRNIQSVTEGGAPIFSKNDWEQTGYELADWIQLSQSDVTVQPGEEVRVNFTMKVPEDASPGSHFGGVFVSAEPPEIEKSGAAVGYQVANIISIRVSGDAVEQGSIRQFSTGKFIYGSQDVDFNVRIENAGNVLIRPRGPLQVTNALGREVGMIMFNESEAGVFPGDTREFAQINWVGDSVGFGRYEAILSAAYGDDGARKTMSSTVTFWVLPINIIGPALGALLVVLLITVIGVRIYIKRTLAQLNVGRRLVRKRNQQSSSMTVLTVVTSLTVIALFLLIMLVLFA